MRPFRRIASLALAALLTTSLLPAMAHAEPATPPAAPAAGTAASGTERFAGNDGKSHKVTWDDKSFMVDGERLNIWSGEVHYWRLPSTDHWRDLLQKIRANGFNAVSLYFFWGFHSNAPGQYDFTGIRDIDKLFKIAKEEGLYVIARPGPYVNAEISMGGLPAYMTNTPEGLRTTNATNMAASKEWMHEFNKIAKKYQVTDGGGSMIMYQVENEMLDESAARAAFVGELVKQVKSDGISVPLFHNDYAMGFRYVPRAHGGKGNAADIGLDFYAYDAYPMGFTCSNARGTIQDTEASFNGRVTNNPKFISEAQGGAFTPWGASFNPDRCDEFIDGNFMRQWGVNNIGGGVTAFNYYMAYGGTNWGYTGSPSSGFTSYDYGAAITEDRALRSKFAVQKSIGYLTDTVKPIANMKRVNSPSLTVNGASVLALARQATEKLDAESVTGHGARYIGLRHDNSNNTQTTTVSFPLALGPAQAVVEKSYTNDDRDSSAITYTGSWGKSPDGAAWAVGNYRNTETYSDKAGDTLSYTFTGTGIQVIMPESLNHGYGEVSIDGKVVGQTNTYKRQNANKQVVAFVKDDLPMGQHTLTIKVTGNKDAASEGTFVSLDALNVITPAATSPEAKTRTNDNDPKVTYTASPKAWTYETGKSWTEGAFSKDQHVTTIAGAEASFTFTGTGIDVISPKSNNHGPAEVLIDGQVVGQFNTCVASQDYVTEQQTVAFSKKDLTNAQHTITIRAKGEVGCPNGNVEAGKFVVIDAFDVYAPGTGTVEPPAPTGVTFDRIPAKADTSLTIHGRDALAVLADLKLGAQDIYYSTSEIVGFESVAAGDLLVLNGYKGDAGELVMKYAAKPTVKVAGAAVEQNWDAARKALRLNFTNGQASTVTITADGKPTLTIAFVDRESIGTMWKVRGLKGSANATTVTFGADLVRGVRYDGATAHLSGSVSAGRSVQVYVPEGITAVTWNGAPLGSVSNGVVTGNVPGPKPVTLPALTFTKMTENPEAAVAFNDSAWKVLDKTTSLNPRQVSGGMVLDSNAYGAYQGNVWYRAKYKAGTSTSSITLRGNGGTGAPGNTNLNNAGGTAAIMQVWANGTYIGSKPANGSNQTFSLPAGTVTAGADTVVAVLVMNLGQNLDWSDDGLSRQNRGLYSASLNASGPVQWKIQGAQGMASPVDEARGLYNNGGLYGERAGWHLPGYPSSNWKSTDTLRSGAGVTWYRSSFNLDLPADQDVMVALNVNSERFAARQDFSRVMLFVNGWNTGLYAGNVGPQTQFTIPTGFLNPKGANEIVAVVSAERDTMGPESLSLSLVSNQTGSVPWASNAAPAMPKIALTAAAKTTSVTPGSPAGVTGSAQIPALMSGTMAKLVVEWGDGQKSESPVGSALDATHTYAADGVYTPKVSLVDAVSGAVLATMSTAAITVGTVAPTTYPVTLTTAPAAADGANGWYKSTPKVTMTSEGSPISYQLDDADWATYLTPVSVPDGSHTIKAKVADGPVASSVFQVDAVAPTVTPAVTGRVLTVTATDATSGIASVVYKLGNGEWQAYTDAVTVPGTNAVEVSVKATDKAGHVANGSVLVNAEGVAPSMTLSKDSVHAGEQVKVDVAGFAPNTPLTVTLHSTPVKVGTLTSDANGAGSITVTIPAGTTLGEHRVVVDQADPLAQASANLTVVAAPKPGTLPATGAAVSIAVFVIAAMIGASVLVIASRRKRATS